ncbi:unnamed protein product (macronuclear) [Paramecium tetraurelia]|uniref:Uncharacterized protein n=1 Tax=Paramecium tetraurelia TaxID=5888 RepID=A0C473_PARTE|nr:uncharacterized protein GSPATT00035070001 [Paramecium tetraurelia]CAK65590.1 unnamed protein product [Paramecium tetraurelia]|eukprot:XP_001432987.1 hypothetical protein (macronuclear) [Paramecium tetraurelia strain d4-2]
MTQKMNQDQTQQQTNKQSSLNSILYLNEQKQMLLLLNIDVNWLKIQAFSCKTRGQLQDRLQIDLAMRNLSIKNSIQNWRKRKDSNVEFQAPTTKLPSQHAQNQQLNQRFIEQKSVELPMLKPISYAFKQIQNKYKQIGKSRQKKTPLHLSAIQCPINNVEFKKPEISRSINSRLHSNKFKTVIEFKVVQENKFFMISDQGREINNIQPQLKLRDQVDTLYSQFFGNINRKRAVTMCNGQTNEIDFEYKTTNLEDKIKVHKF